MKQIVQDHKTGHVRLEEVPAPSPRRGRVLVTTAASLVSAGTERQTVSFGRASLLEKARSRPDLVRQVIEKARNDGIVSTWKAAEGRLEDWVALGYSCAGTVEAVGDGVPGLKVGDRVACAGQDRASHAEVVSLPPTLLARIPDGVSFEDAAFATVGAIALHGIHRANVAPGDRVAVIGLGLLGQLTVQLLAAYGNPVFGIDLRRDAVQRALDAGAAAGAVTGEDDVDAAAALFAQGGVDAVVVTASTPSSEPLRTAARLVRRRGRVCVVGLVGMEADRRAFYDKEIELTVAKSYGPGRDDPNYEERGLDYAPELSRWTIARNMEEFLRLLAAGKVRVAPLVVERVQLDEAPASYQRLVEGVITDGSILIHYRGGPARLATEVRYEAPPPAGPSKPRVAFVGAGAFARSVLLPAIARARAADLRVVVATSPAHAAQSARRFGFARAATDAATALAADDVNTVFIATRHDLHASLAASALRAGRHVFVEKPLALSRDELETVLDAARGSSGLLHVGFNRRFAPLAVRLRDHFARRSGPLLMHYRVNAGPLPAGHWLRDPSAGGGRILGEVCHFVDTLQFLAASRPVRVVASGGTRDAPPDDHLACTIDFADGSRGSIHYTAHGPASLSKERVEVIGSGRSGALENFRRLELRDGSRVRRHRTLAQDKGHAAEVASFLSAIERGGPAPVPVEDLAATTIATLAIAESLRDGAFVDLEAHP